MEVSVADLVSVAGRQYGPSVRHRGFFVGAYGTVSSSSASSSSVLRSSSSSFSFCNDTQILDGVACRRLYTGTTNALVLEFLLNYEFALVQTTELVDLVLVLPPNFDLVADGLLVRLGELQIRCQYGQ